MKALLPRLHRINCLFNDSLLTFGQERGEGEKKRNRAESGQKGEVEGLVIFVQNVQIISRILGFWTRNPGQNGSETPLPRD